MNKYVVKANLFFYFMTTSYYIKSRNNIYILHMYRGHRDAVTRSM